METRHEACSAEGQPRNILTSIGTDSGRASPWCHVAVTAFSTAVVGFFTISHPIRQDDVIPATSRAAPVRAGARLTRPQRDVPICSGLEQASIVFAFINSKP